MSYNDVQVYSLSPVFPANASKQIHKHIKYEVTGHAVGTQDIPICWVKDQAAGEKIMDLLSKGNPPSWFIVKQDPSGPAKAGGPFFVMDSGVESVMKPTGVVCEVGDRVMADSICELMNNAENGNQAMQCAGNDSNYSAEDYRLSYTQKWTKEYTGTILTLLDASIPNAEQNAALKKLVKKAARELLSLQWKVFVDPIYERMHESTSTEIDLS